MENNTAKDETLDSPYVKDFKILFGGTPKAVIAAGVIHKKLLGPEGQKTVRKIYREYEFREPRELVSVLADEAKMNLEDIIWGLYRFIFWLNINPEFLKETGGKYELGVVAAAIIIETEQSHPDLYDWNEHRDSLLPFATWNKSKKRWSITQPKDYEVDYPEDPARVEARRIMSIYNAIAFATHHVPGIDYNDPSIDIADIFNAQIASGELGNFLLTGKMGIFDDLSSDS